MAQLDFADSVPTYHASPAMRTDAASGGGGVSAVDAADDMLSSARPMHDLLGALKMAFNAVMEFAPALVAQPASHARTLTTVTMITATTAASASSSASASASTSSSASAAASSSSASHAHRHAHGAPADTLSSPGMTTTTTTTTTLTTTTTIVAQRSCVDFLRRLLGAGASDVRINALPVRTLCVVRGGERLAYGQDTCAICLDGYAVLNRVRVLACQHVFHAACIDPWLRRGRPTCPLCQSVCC